MTYYIYYRTSSQYDDRDNYPCTRYDDPEYLWADNLNDIKIKITTFINERARHSAVNLIKTGYYNYRTCVEKLSAGIWPTTLAEDGLEFITPIFYIDDDADDAAAEDWADIFRKKLHTTTLELFRDKVTQDDGVKKKVLEAKEAEERLLLEKLLHKYPK